jgi:hypothetical protein
MGRLLGRLYPKWDELMVLVSSAERIEMEVAVYRTEEERGYPLSLNLEPDAMAALGLLRPSIQFSIYSG